jgi:hypothetical protein
MGSRPPVALVSTRSPAFISQRTSFRRETRIGFVDFRLIFFSCSYLHSLSTLAAIQHANLPQRDTTLTSLSEFLSHHNASVFLALPEVSESASAFQQLWPWSSTLLRQVTSDLTINFEYDCKLTIQSPSFWASSFLVSRCAILSTPPKTNQVLTGCSFLGQDFSRFFGALRPCPYSSIRSTERRHMPPLSSRARVNLVAPETATASSCPC